MPLLLYLSHVTVSSVVGGRGAQCIASKLQPTKYEYSADSVCAEQKQTL